MMTSLEIPVDDGTVYAIRGGSGPPLVLLHGGGVDHRMWRHQLESFAPDHHVVAIDARGHGASSTPTAPFRHAEDVVTVLRTLDLAPATLVGLSLGASTAVDVTVEAPELVAGLVVIGAGVGATPEEFHDPWVHEVFADWAAAQEQLDPEAWLDAFLRFVVGPRRVGQDVSRELLQEVRTMGRETLERHARPDAVGPTVLGHARDHLDDITVPVLAIHGAADSLDHHRMAAEIADAAGGEQVTIADTAHYPPLERPEEFDAALGAWLNRKA